MINVKSVAAYVFVIAIAVLFMLFLDGPGGCYLLIALSVAAVCSVAIAVYTKKTVSVKMKLNSELINRNDSVISTLVIKKRGFLPSAVISAELYSSYHFSACGQQNFKTAVFGTEKLEFTSEYKGRFFGKGKIGLGSVIISDYFGFVSLRLNISEAIKEVKIYPDIPDVKERDGLAMSLTDAAVFDESEETTQSLYAINGVPGYEHRKYEPGDSLKLINWKLSAKRGELYVRRLEGSSGAEQLFILDKSASKAEGDTAREFEQLAVEGMLSLMMSFAKSELPVRLMIRLKDVWEEFAVATPADVFEIRYKLTDFVFSGDPVGRFPNCESERTVIFSACPDGRLYDYADTKNAVCAVAAENLSGENVWKISRDNTDICFIS